MDVILLSKTTDHEEQEILEYVKRKYLQKGITINSQSAKGFGYAVMLKKNKRRIFLTFYLSKEICVCVIECPAIRMHVSKTLCVDMTYYKKRKAQQWLKVILN